MTLAVGVLGDLRLPERTHQVALSVDGLLLQIAAACELGHEVLARRLHRHDRRAQDGPTTTASTEIHTRSLIDKFYYAIGIIDLDYYADL